MAPGTDAAAASVYDLGYRNYAGVRLGRSHAIAALYLHSLRGIFGLGRHMPAKIIPIGLLVVALLPAVVQLGVAAIASGRDVRVSAADDYYQFIQWPLALFVAAVAPELVGRDQRDRTLSLYFSRALLRSDYVLAKVAALTTALLLLTLGPQAVVFLGNGVAGDGAWSYIRDNWQDIGPIVASGALLSLFISTVGLAIASQTPRWPLASGGIVAYFAISWVVGGIVVNSISHGPLGYSLLVSGFHVMRGLTLWIFGVTPTPPRGEGNGDLSSDLAKASAPLFAYAVAAAVTAGLALMVLLRRYSKLVV